SFNPEQPLNLIGISGSSPVHYNNGVSQLYEAAILRGEGEIAAYGPLRVLTGAHTGRSAQDKFVVRDTLTDHLVWWDNNKPISPAQFEALEHDMKAFAAGRELYVQDLYCGADPAYRAGVRVVTELAWHALFIRHLLRRPELAEVMSFVPELTILNLPSFKAD